MEKKISDETAYSFLDKHISTSEQRLESTMAKLVSAVEQKMENAIVARTEEISEKLKQAEKSIQSQGTDVAQEISGLETKIKDAKNLASMVATLEEGFSKGLAELSHKIDSHVMVILVLYNIHDIITRQNRLMKQLKK